MNFIIQLIVGVVLSIASTLLKQAFSKPQDQKRTTGTRGTTSFGGRVPQSFLIGTIADGGKQEYPRKSWGNAGEVPNAYTVDVTSYGDLPITGLVGMFINGVRVTVAASGSDARGNPVAEYNSGGHHFWWRFHDGNQTAADSYLVSKFSSDADHPYGSDMIGLGLPYLVTTALWDEKLWTGFPQVMGEFQGIKLYDRRKDSSVGGSGLQRWANPSTWAFSDNNMVIIENIERGIHYNAPGATTLGPHIWGGRKTDAQLPYDAWSAAMDACDLAINLKGGGTEKQFRGGRKISLNERPADVIKEFLIGANSRICHGSDGTVWPLVGVPDEADFAFTDADVLATEELGSIPFPNLDEIINGATATYREPSQAWEDKETAPYYRSDLEEEDDGRRQVEGLDLGTTFSGTQAQRILKAVVEEGRRFGRHVVALPAAYAQFRPLQVGAWTSDRFGYSGKKFLITVRTRPIWGWVVFGLQEIDPADHAWNPETDEQPLSFAPVVTNRPPPQEVSGFFVEPTIVVDNDGASRRPAIDVFWSSASVGVDVRSVRVSIYLNGAADPEEDDPILGTLVWEGDVPPERGSSRHTEAIMPNVYYVVVIRYIAESGRETLESGMLAVQALNVKLGSSDIAIDLSNVAQDVLDAMGLNPRAIIEQFKQIGTLLEEADRENYTKREALFREISVQLGDLEASFTEIIEAALDPDTGAIALVLQNLYAAMGGNTAEVNVRWEAAAAPDGYSARYVLQAAVNDGTFRAATLFLDVPADPGQPTRIGLMAGQTAFFTSTGVPIALISEDGFFRSANGAVEINMLTGDASFGV